LRRLPPGGLFLAPPLPDGMCIKPGVTVIAVDSLPFHKTLHLESRPVNKTLHADSDKPVCGHWECFCRASQTSIQPDEELVAAAGKLTADGIHGDANAAETI
jgi:hypothetical protein